MCELPRKHAAEESTPTALRSWCYLQFCSCAHMRQIREVRSPNHLPNPNQPGKGEAAHIQTRGVRSRRVFASAQRVKSLNRSRAHTAAVVPTSYYTSAPRRTCTSTVRSRLYSISDMGSGHSAPVEGAPRAVPQGLAAFSSANGHGNPDPAAYIAREPTTLIVHASLHSKGVSRPLLTVGAPVATACPLQRLVHNAS